MCNLPISIPYLFLLTSSSFLIVLTIKNLFIQNIRSIIFFHLSLFIVFLIATVGGMRAQSDGYERLEKFTLLEKKIQLNQIKNNSEDYDSMLQIDIEAFKNSQEFRYYLEVGDTLLAKLLSICAG